MRNINVKMENNQQFEIATLAGGCFWCLEAVYQNLKGVAQVVSGYSNGQVDNPSYEAVCTGMTGHAEVVQITFDSTQVSYAELLEIFWKIHDPTTPNRQGNDVGTQYRSGIYFHNEKQQAIAKKSLEALNESGIWEVPAVTEIEPLKNYFPAEKYHQDYYKLNPNQPYCSAIVGPKVEKFKQLFRDKLKAD